MQPFRSHRNSEHRTQNKESRENRVQPLRCYRAARVSKRSFAKACGYLASLLLAVACLSLRAAGPPAFRVVGGEPGPWAEIFGAVGIRSGGASQQTGIFVLRDGEAAAGADWAARVASGAYLILEGDSETGRWFGFRPAARRVRAVSVEDLRYPRLEIVWERPVEVPVFDLPGEARVFARDRWSGAPLVAGFRRGAGAVLWLALSPGSQGYERFPYLLHALSDLGLSPPFRSRRLWAFFDSSYRARVDPDYLADRWRRAGICGLHIAAWHFFEPDPARDDYLRRLIESCHRRGILAYAWLELPHVSEKFWEEHPAWREKTALLGDAQPRLAEAHESPERRVFPGGRHGRARPSGPVRLGRRQPRGTVLRVSCRGTESLALHSHERGCAARILRAKRDSIRWNCSTGLPVGTGRETRPDSGSSSTSAPSWHAGCRRSGWP